MGRFCLLTFSIKYDIVLITKNVPYMIKITQSLVKGGERFPNTFRVSSLQEAIEHMVHVHFNWGGSILNSDDDKIVLTSRCFDNLDTTTYEGDFSEMKVLFMLVTYQNMTSTSWSQTHRELLSKTKGERRSRITLGIMGKFAHPESPILQVSRLEDVVASYILHKETGCYMEEALALAGEPLLVAAHR